jgi:hypothetical protein
LSKVCGQKINGFLRKLSGSSLPVRKYISPAGGIDHITSVVIVVTMKGDITGVIRSLQTTAVNRCRERIEDAALKARGLIGKQDPEDAKGEEPADREFGVTSVLKRRHGL